MVRLVMVILFGAVIGSMAIALFAYTQYQTNYITSVAGQTVTVGPVEYVITFDGTHAGSESVTPENVFVKIGITAKNVSSEETLMTGGQFYFVDENDKKHRAVYGEFSAKDLYEESLQPDEPIERTTQFDVPFDKEQQYEIIIRPQKMQSTLDTAVICITNC